MNIFLFMNNIMNYDFFINKKLLEFDFKVIYYG